MLRVARPANRTIAEERAGQRQRTTLALAIEKVRVGKILFPIQFCVPSFCVPVYRNKLAWLWIRQRPQQNAIDYGKHHRRSSHAQCQRQNSNYCEARTLPQHPHRVPQALPKILQPARPPRIPALLFNLFRPAERHPRAPLRFRKANPAGHQFVRMLLQMKAHLVLQLLFHLVASQ